MCDATLSVNGQTSKCQETGAHDVHTSAAGSWTAGAEPEPGGRPDWVQMQVEKARIDARGILAALRELKRNTGKDLGLS